MGIVVVTGSAGLIGSAAVRHYAGAGHLVVGIDNDMRARFFGPEASTAPTRDALVCELGAHYLHYHLDVRDSERIEELFSTYSSDIEVVVHAASQPSHDWAARDPRTDFDINASATLTLLEATRHYAPAAAFIFTSTNKVYGDSPNRLPFVELPTRWDLPVDHPAYDGIPESMSIDASLHSLFGVSKTSADLLVQEYGRYFGLRTVVFRCGCLTGRASAGAPLHGFLSYLVRCFRERRPYQIIGYAGKQVRDIIHSADVISVFDAYVRSGLPGGRVYNLGGGRRNSCSVLEAISMCRHMCGHSIELSMIEAPRVGDHQWYITDLSRIREDFPDWRITHSLESTVTSMLDAMTAAA
jgi:CDP-paratose 2-epimerase